MINEVLEFAEPLDVHAGNEVDPALTAETDPVHRLQLLRNDLRPDEVNIQVQAEYVGLCDEALNLA